MRYIYTSAGDIYNETETETETWPAYIMTCFQ